MNYIGLIWRNEQDRTTEVSKEENLSTLCWKQILKFSATTKDESVARF